VIDFKIVVNDLILTATSTKWHAKKKKLKLPNTEKQKYQKTYKKDYFFEYENKNRILNCLEENSKNGLSYIIRKYYTSLPDLVIPINSSESSDVKIFE